MVARKLQPVAAWIADQDIAGAQHSRDASVPIFILRPPSIDASGLGIGDSVPIFILRPPSDRRQRPWHWRYPARLAAAGDPRNPLRAMQAASMSSSIELMAANMRRVNSSAGLPPAASLSAGQAQQLALAWCRSPPQKLEPVPLGQTRQTVHLLDQEHITGFRVLEQSEKLRSRQLLRRSRFRYTFRRSASRGRLQKLRFHWRARLAAHPNSFYAHLGALSPGFRESSPYTRTTRARIGSCVAREGAEGGGPLLGPSMWSCPRTAWLLFARWCCAAAAGRRLDCRPRHSGAQHSRDASVPIFILRPPSIDASGAWHWRYPAPAAAGDPR